VPKIRNRIKIKFLAERGKDPVGRLLFRVKIGSKKVWLPTIAYRTFALLCLQKKIFNKNRGPACIAHYELHQKHYRLPEIISKLRAELIEYGFSQYAIRATSKGFYSINVPGRYIQFEYPEILKILEHDKDLANRIKGFHEMLKGTKINGQR